jgi:S-DNA-T family DNA segregation ATPase FtsK/SpoIIIE
MGDWRRWLRPTAMAVGAGFGLFLATSLIGYDPADWPGRAVVWPQSPPPPANPCGPVGAILAATTMQAVGWGALVAYLGAGLWIYAARRGARIGPVPARLAGFAVFTLIASIVLHLWIPAPGRVPPVGPGGWIGAAAGAALAESFGMVGTVFVLVGVSVVGAILCGEALLLTPARDIAALARRIPWQRLRRRTAAAAAGAHPAYRPNTAMVPAPQRVGRVAALPNGAPAARKPALAPLDDDDEVGDDEDDEAPLAPARASVATAPRLLPSIRPPEPAPARRAAGAAPKVQGKIPLDQYAPPPLELLDPPAPFSIQEHEARIHERALLLERTLAEFGHNIRVVQINTGPVITQFEIELEAGLRVARIINLADDLAIALAVPSVRIVSPIPGKTTVGVEIPNERRMMVRLGEVIQGVQADLRKWRIPLFLGKDVKGNPLAFDLSKMPHLLIAGRTGTGKSVCLNAMITSILTMKQPDEVKLLLIDPKQVEMTQYHRIPHLLHPVVTDMKKAESLLAWACDKMDERYSMLARAGVRSLADYNLLTEDDLLERIAPEDDEEAERIPRKMASIVIIIDEFADLICTAPKEVEEYVVRLAQKARAVGMHLILATQKPTVDVITGLIKGNVPARIAFQVFSRQDSRVVLDEIGAHRLLGDGDMLFLIPGTSHIVRAQGTYVSDEEINRICSYLERYPVEFSKEVMQAQLGGGGLKDRAASLKERDELYESAIEVVIREGRGSCSLLQRALGIGYGRASRLIDFMAADGIVGEYKVGGPREVAISLEEWEAMKSGAAGGSSAA